MFLFVTDLLQHFIVNLLQLLQHLMEGRPLLRVISEHVIGEVLPIRMELAVILHSPLSYLIQMPLILQILEGLNVMIELP